MIDRLTALETFPVISVEVYPTIQHRNLGGWTIKADTDGVLPRNIRLTRLFSTAAQSVTINLPWVDDDIEPDDVNLSHAWGEVKVDGETWLWGKVTTWKWGDRYQDITVTITENPVIAQGDFWEPGKEFDADRFSDINNIYDDRAIAPESAGLLPPIPIAAIGSRLYSPCSCIQDEVVTPLTPRRFLMTEYRPADTTSSHSFKLLDDEKETAWHSYASTISHANDYWYLDGNLLLSFGPGVTNFTNGSATVTCSQIGGHLNVGDIIRDSTDTDNDWLDIVSIDGTTITLSGPYTGAGGGASGYAILLPKKAGHPLLWSLANGGIADPNRDGAALCYVTDVLMWSLRAARLTIPVAWGDLVALRQRLMRWMVGTILTERVDPLKWSQEKLLSWLPIRAVRLNGTLRFRWIGPIDNRDIVTTLADEDVYRDKPFRYGPEAIPQVQVSCRWDMWREKYAQVVTSSAGTGRAFEAEAQAI